VNPNEYNTPTTPNWKRKIRIIVFGTDTVAGKSFDVILLASIIVSIGVVLLDSIKPIHEKYGDILLGLEWFFTILFTLEYILRLLCARSAIRYVTSFMGLIDLLAILPVYLSLFIPGTQSLVVFRALRLLRVFRIFKLYHFLKEINFLTISLIRSLKKISIFMLTVLLIVIVLGSVMYVVERGHNGFSSIPTSIYWAIVTITTVGYGDIVPYTGLGKLIAGVIMLLGYSIIAVPTGIITSEMASLARKESHTKEKIACLQCQHTSNDTAKFCSQCGNPLKTIHSKDS
jgi:voltage-gated potassium channel